MRRYIWCRGHSAVFVIAQFSWARSRCDQDMSKALRLGCRSDHPILIQKPKFCCRFCLHFRHYLCCHIHCCDLSLHRIFSCSRSQAWIVKSLMSVCDKPLFYFKQRMIFLYFGILKRNWSIWHLLHNVLYVTLNDYLSWGWKW